MGRAPCCDKSNVKKGPWSPEEDAKLKSYIEQNGTGGNWIALPQKIGLKRCGKSCRLRWLNYLRPNIKHGGFSDEEDSIICSLYMTIGSRWSIIAAQLPGRTDNDIKNYWNTRLKKKLLGKQRKEQHLQARRISGLEQESLLMKLGGRFSSNDESIHQSGNMEQLLPTSVTSSAPNVMYPPQEGSSGYVAATSMEALSNPSYQFQHSEFIMEEPGVDLLQGLQQQPNDIAQLGFEFVYSDELYNNRNGDEGMTYWQDALL